jgi:hypothetical protein
MNNLKEAVLEIADEMETAAQEADMKSTRLVVTSWAKMLRIACKAAGDDAPVPAMNMMGSPLLTPEVQNRNEIEKAKAEFRKLKAAQGPPPEDKITVEEKYAGRMAEIVDGPAMDGMAVGDTTMFPIDPQMPSGAKCFVEAWVYQLRRDGKLYYVGEAEAKPAIVEG